MAASGSAAAGSHFLQFHANLRHSQGDKSMIARRFLPFAAALGVGLAVSTPASAVSYSVRAIDLGSLGLGKTLGEVIVTGINASGQVVGVATSTTGVLHAFITGANGSGVTELGTLGGTGSWVYGINATGQVVGAASTKDGELHAFITGANGRGMTDLGTRGGWSEAYGINATGQVVGAASTKDGAWHAFITGASGVGMTDLGTFGGGNSSATGINASGQVVGYAATAHDGANHAFITGVNGVGMSDLGTLYGENTYAIGINATGQVVGVENSDWHWDTNDWTTYVRSAFITGAKGEMIELCHDCMPHGINASGQVVGHFDDPLSYKQPDLHAFITGTNGVGRIDLNSLVTPSLDPYAYFNEAWAINDRGQIAGRRRNGDLYLLSPFPVPEPETYALILAGLGLVGFVARRKQGPTA
jgi:probable HAF family extracellular repeat protein